MTRSALNSPCCVLLLIHLTLTAGAAAAPPTSPCARPASSRRYGQTTSPFGSSPANPHGSKYRLFQREPELTRSCRCAPGSDPHACTVEGLGAWSIQGTRPPSRAESPVLGHNRSCGALAQDENGVVCDDRNQLIPVHGRTVRLQLFALAYNLANFVRRLALPGSVRHWSLTTLREKLVKIGAKVVRHARNVTFQMAEVAIPRRLFATIQRRIGRLCPVPL